MTQDYEQPTVMQLRFSELPELDYANNVACMLEIQRRLPAGAAILFAHHFPEPRHSLVTVALPPPPCELSALA